MPTFRLLVTHDSGDPECPPWSFSDAFVATDRASAEKKCKEILAGMGHTVPYHDIEEATLVIVSWQKVLPVDQWNKDHKDRIDKLLSNIDQDTAYDVIDHLRKKFG